MVGWQGKKGLVYNWFINVSVWLRWECGSVSRKQCVVHHSVFPYVLYKAPPQCNLASQCRLNDHIFQEKDVQLSHISNPVVSHFMNQSLGLWFFPLTIAQALFLYGSRSEMLSVKTSFWKHTVAMAKKKKSLSSASANSRGYLDFMFLFLLFSWFHPWV